MNQSPSKPWKKGVNADYTAFQLVVNICQDAHGNVWSDHDCLTQADRDLSIGLPQGGAPQTAHALLTEAVRREVYLCVLLQMSKDVGFLERWATAVGDTKDQIEDDLRSAVYDVISKTVPKMAAGAVPQVLTMLADHVVGSTSDSIE